jgi:hypothetical protein
MTFTYLIYQEGTGARVSRSDGRTDCLTGLYDSVVAAQTTLYGISDREPGLETFKPDVERKTIKNGRSEKYPPRARGTR